MSQKAIEILEASRAEVARRRDQELAEIDAAIARLRAAEEKPRHDVDGHLAVRRNQYKGLKGSEALWPYLLERQDELPLPSTVVVADLKAGGADMGQPDRAERNLKISASNNDRYVYDEKNDTWDLAMRKKSAS
jgi:hypothetical protein